MKTKFPIHTTLSADAIKVLERYEKELGAKNVVLEKALLNLDSTRFKAKLDTQNIDRIIKRVTTGIPGMDDFLEGGFPKGFAIVVTGPPGTGKTTFSMQYLMEGVKNGERCIFFSFEERAQQLVQHFARFGWDVGKYIDDGYLEIFGISMLTSEEMMEIIDSHKPERVVFDSMNVLTAPSDFRTSTSWRGLHRLLKKNQTTAILVTEKSHGIEIKEYDDFDFLGDGVVFLDFIQTNDIDTTPMPVMAVHKMRATRVDHTPQPFRFTNNGIAKYRALNIPSKVLQDRIEKRRAERLGGGMSMDEV
ncbi:RAD55 family ATPase [Methanolobus bombayensis]|uniref:RAD55 family ATPase n=1 Tax=Methanolobus bombayensis TaxID=38023 RepID=UPI001AE1630B|nr:ATPase domain-containing protein [Methanolobus bombayensis]MBP1910042.1 KaiC/GvpD/RAD55 family RecA-like ATPase [Methanolobus bombayensis]